MTKREMFETIATINADNAEIVTFCEHEIELLDAHKSYKKGLTAVQKANLEVKETIMAVLAEADVPHTVSELLTDTRLAGFTNQKISALLRQMVLDGKVTKISEGKKTKFALA